MPAFLVLSPVVAVEGIGPVASVGRSWRLTIRRRASTMIGLVLTSLGVTFGLRAIITGIGVMNAARR